ncbi:MAG: NgoPII family restriction endonuclease [Betaproteobacteria bacterium]
MTTNLLKAIKNLHDIKGAALLFGKGGASRNRVNSVGESLEEFVKDLFCNSLTEAEESKYKTHSKHFSYLGAKNSPPDIILRNSDAIEVKKIESLNASIALNSSYPKDKLYADSTLIQDDCRKCEDWDVKDFLYVVGVVKNNKLLSLWFVYGDCYAASKHTYERISNKISNGLSELGDIELSETNELGRVNQVDPLKITHLRIRGMWGIENPNKVFSYISLAKSDNFFMNALILDEKYNSFPEVDRSELEKLQDGSFKIQNVEIKSPKNPANLLNAKLISLVR